MAEVLWKKVYEAADEDHWKLYVIGSLSMSCVIFLAMNIIFGCLDIFGMPNILRQFKIQKDKNIPMGQKKYLWTMVVATFNMTVVVFAMLLLTWDVAAKHRVRFHPTELPTLWNVVIDILLCTVFNDIWFYYVHRLLHHPSLYKRIHKMHHDWTAPCAMATFYCHPVEHALANLGCFIMGPSIIGSHLSTTWLFWSLGHISTTLAHSGYHLPFLPSSQAHDYHHSRCKDQYSTIGVLDWLHGTNKSFKKSQNFKRHFFLCQFVPAEEIVKS